MSVPVELDPDVDDAAPAGNAITPYDERHYVTYLRLLDAKADGADGGKSRTSSCIAIRPMTKRGPGDAGKAISRGPNGCRGKAVGGYWNRRSRRNADGRVTRPGV